MSFSQRDPSTGGQRNQAPNESSLAIDLEIEAEAYTLRSDLAGVLEFLTSPERRSVDNQFITVMSKDAAIWGGFASAILFLSPPDPFHPIDLEIAVLQSVRALGDALPDRPRLVSSDIQSSELRFGPPDHVVARVLMDGILKKLRPDDREWAERVVSLALEHTHSGYSGCVDKGYVIDPVIETGVLGGLAILGFIPFNIVKRSKKGEAVYHKVQAALWKYERKRKAGGEVEVELTFAVAKIARVLKNALLHAFHEMTAEAGEEPDAGLS